ncbi:HAMP domain-containing histidine kinase [Streptosporangium sp. NBC_01755]|uniref:HAMP domain-containing sensor histidine kinase n=1 Tax=unclassified Streptosporangium TaxID=2632669 RepID=UPI002DDC204A|nr:MULTISPECIES: HAMP domain-containing sensor histidine kinase [unclassified Streptosporangium]WSA26128.1 HAMP domain-containing histidine kinase [Streptosporangium sp. NBC_01810]WSD02442.1 HAMP domain-containing histidine kinase [Streptosporangium sp. NBC_01755]
MKRAYSGLRGRLVITFTLIAVAASSLVAGIGYELVKSRMIGRAEQVAVNGVRDVLEGIRVPIGALWPGDSPPTDDEISALQKSLRPQGGRVVVRYEDFFYPDGEFGIRNVPGDLSARATQRMVAKRQTIDGDMWLLIGTPVWRIEPIHTAQPTGMTVFVFAPLVEEERLLSGLRQPLAVASVAMLIIALALGLVSARRVLLPVRRLGSAARALGAGHLDTRLPVRGQDELAELTATFNDTAAALERSVSELRSLEAMSRRFVADVSHELRTPLTAMTAVTDMLSEEAERLPPEPAAAVRLVLREIARLRTLVEQLIEASRFDSGTATLNVDTVNIIDVIWDCLEMRGWSDQVRVNVPQGLVFSVDPRRFDVIVANLVGNALRHGEPPVLVTARSTPNGLEVKVRDHGKGIPAKDLPFVFNRFYKAGARGDGSGLGLSIARANAQLHGGTISVRVQRPGTLFTVWLPPV